MHAEQAYLFRHVLLRDAAYQMQLPTDRGTLHGLCLDLLEELTSSDPRLLASASLEMADHADFAATSLPSESANRATYKRRELPHLLRAMRYAVAHYRHPEVVAVAHRVAGNPAARPGDVSAAMLTAAESLILVGKFVLAGECLQKAQVSCPPELQCKLVGLYARIQQTTGNLPAALEEYKRAVSVTPAPGDESDRVMVVINYAVVLILMGHMDTAETVLRGTLESPLARQDARVAATTQGNLGLLFLQQGHYDKARPLLEQALRACEQSGDRAYQAVCMANLGLVLEQTEQPLAASEQFQAALELFRQVGDLRNQAMCSANRVTALQKLGRHDEATRATRFAVDAASEFGDALAIAFALGVRGKLHCELRRFDQAESDLSRGIQIAGTNGMVRMHGMLLGQLGNVYREQKRYELAAEQYRLAAAESSRARDDENLGRWLAQQAVALAALGREDEVPDLWNQAMSIVGDRENGELRRDLEAYLAEAREFARSCPS